MTYFNAQEILKFAVRIEESGEEFYSQAAALAESGEAKQIFQYLAGQEREHKATFESMAAEANAASAQMSFSGDYQAYLEAYLDNILFPVDTISSRVTALNDIFNLLNFGIKSELDSILFYHESKRMLPASQHDVIDKIIEEERRHFIKLLELKKIHKG